MQPLLGYDVARSWTLFNLLHPGVHPCTVACLDSRPFTLLASNGVLFRLPSSAFSVTGIISPSPWESYDWYQMRSLQVAVVRSLSIVGSMAG